MRRFEAKWLRMTPLLGINLITVSHACQDQGRQKGLLGYPKGFSGGNRVILPIPILPCETCETRLSAKMSFICMRTKSHFHINGFAFSLAR